MRATSVAIGLNVRAPLGAIPLDTPLPSNALLSKSKKYFFASARPEKLFAAGLRLLTASLIRIVWPDLENPPLRVTHAIALVKRIKLIKMIKPIIASALLAAFLISLISFLSLIFSCCRGTHLQRTARISHGLGSEQMVFQRYCAQLLLLAVVEPGRKRLPDQVILDFQLIYVEGAQMMLGGETPV